VADVATTSEPVKRTYTPSEARLAHLKRARERALEIRRELKKKNTPVSNDVPTSLPVADVLPPTVTDKVLPTPPVPSDTAPVSDPVDVIAPANADTAPSEPVPSTPVVTRKPRSRKQPAPKRQRSVSDDGDDVGTPEDSVATVTKRTRRINPTPVSPVAEVQEGFRRDMDGNFYFIR